MALVRTSNQSSSKNKSNNKFLIDFLRTDENANAKIHAALVYGELNQLLSIFDTYDVAPDQTNQEFLNGYIEHLESDNFITWTCQYINQMLNQIFTKDGSFNHETLEIFKDIVNNKSKAMIKKTTYDIKTQLYGELPTENRIEDIATLLVKATIIAISNKFIFACSEIGKTEYDYLATGIKNNKSVSNLEITFISLQKHLTYQLLKTMQTKTEDLVIHSIVVYLENGKNISASRNGNFLWMDEHEKAIREVLKPLADKVGRYGFHKLHSPAGIDFYAFIDIGITAIVALNQGISRHQQVAFLEKLRVAKTEQELEMLIKNPELTAKTKADLVLEQVQEVKKIVIEDIEKLIERGEKIENLVTKTNELAHEGLDFKIKAKNLRLSYECPSLYTLFRFFKTVKEQVSNLVTKQQSEEESYEYEYRPLPKNGQ